MKLYKTDNGTWAGTQADGKKIAKEEGCSFELVEVPTDKPGLLGFLNEMEIDSHDRAAAEVHGRLEAEQPKAVTPIRQSQESFTASEIEEFILNRASVQQVENIMACLGTRFAELVSQRKAA